MKNQTPIDLMNDARKDATNRLVTQQQSFKEAYVTRPAVSEKESPTDANRKYALVRNDQSEIGAMVDQYGLKRTIAMLKDGERKLQRRMS